METISLGFIGGGRITKIMLQAFSKSEKKFNNIVVFDNNTEVLDALKAKYPFITVGNVIEAASQPVVFIALHPPVIMETLVNISASVTPETIVISLAPKITIEKIASKLQTKNIARLIPNATSYINKGYNPVAFNPEMDLPKRKPIIKLLKILGKTVFTDESKLEAYAITSAMLPTYFWFQFQELEAIAQQLGLSSKEASKTIKATMKQAIKLYYDADLNPSEVIDLIPVKPIGDHETDIKAMYQAKLTGLYEKIKPV